MQISVTETDNMAIKKCGSDSHCVTVRDPSPRHCPMGLGRNLDLCWMEKMASGKRELDDRVVCCKVPWTEITTGQLIIATS